MKIHVIWTACTCLSVVCLCDVLVLRNSLHKRCVKRDVLLQAEFGQRHFHKDVGISVQAEVHIAVTSLHKDPKELSKS